MTGTPSTTLQLHGKDFAAALRSGIFRVIGEQDALNRINVFPVADADTGTNLTLSLSAALDLVSRPGPQHLGTLLADIADRLLDSARGNSGAIIAQFFQGLSDDTGDHDRFTPRTFARAVTVGSEYAHDALSDPQEGTILSVIAAFAASLDRGTSAGAETDFAGVLRDALRVTSEALARTRDQLEVLRKADVVDAGAKGFALLVEGMVQFIVDGRVAEKPGLADVADQAGRGAAAGSETDLQHRFCTECVITASVIDRRKLREALSVKGDSLVIAGSKTKARIHIHTNDPEGAFELARGFGAVRGEKADDMHRQQHVTHGARSAFAVITDSAADISDDDMERLDIHMVPARIQFGNRGYLDKVGITSEEFFTELERNPVHPTTSQPSPGDFRRQYQFLASHFPDVLSVNLTPAVSGTLQAAQSAAQRSTASGSVHVVNSLNASVGQGLLTVFAAECAQAGVDIRTTIAAVEELIPLTFTYGLIKDLRYAVRGGRVAASRKWMADFLHLTPVLRTEPDGRLTANAIIPGRRRLLPRFARFIARRTDTDSSLRITVGHARCPEDAVELERLIRECLPRVAKSGITELGPALGVHGGPGTLAVAVQHYRRPEELLR